MPSLDDEFEELRSLKKAADAKQSMAEMQQADLIYPAAGEPTQEVASPQPRRTASVIDLLSGGGGVPMTGTQVAGQMARQFIGRDEDINDLAMRGLPLAGSLAGGIGGAAVSGGNPTVAAGGATMGNIAGELLATPYKMSKNEPMMGARELGLQSLIQGGTEFFGPATERVLNFAAKKVVGPLTRDVPIDNRVLRESVGVRKANDILKTVAQDMKPRLVRKYGQEVADNITQGVLMATDLTENRVMDAVENYVRDSVFSGKKLTALRQAQEDIISDIPNFIAKTYGEVLDPEDIAATIASTVRNVDDLRRGQAGSIYDYIGDRLGPSQIVRVGNVGGRHGSMVQALRGAMNELEQNGLSIEGTSEALRIAESLPNYSSFGAAKTLKTYMGNLVRSLREVNPKNTQIAVLKEMEQDLGHAMRVAVKQYDRGRSLKRAETAAIDPASPRGKVLAKGIAEAKSPTTPPLYPLLRFANESYADIENRTGSAIIEGWMESVEKKNAGPEVLTKLTNTPENTRLILNSVGKQSRSADLLRQWHVQKLWSDATKDGKFSPERLDDILSDALKSPANVTRELYGDQGIQDLRRFAVGPKFIRNRDTAAGSMGVRFSEAGMIATLAAAPATVLAMSDSNDSDGAVKTAAKAIAPLFTYAVSVRFLARAFASPTTRQFLLDAQRFGPRTRRGAAAVGQLMAFATKDEIVPIPEKASREELSELNQMRGLQ